MLFRSPPAFSSKPSCRALRIGVCGVLMLLCGATNAWAQLATVRGRVTDAAKGESLPGTAVVLQNLDDGTQTGTATDGNGYFILGRIAPGAYTLTASFVGYLARTDTLTLDFNDNRSLELTLERDQAELDEVVVESERQATNAQGGAGFTSIRPSQLARVPAPSVSTDLAGYLQTLPGVVATGDRGGQLFVRGGTPTQNLVLLDGMPIFQPFHIVGAFSAFPADIIAYADVHTGGFGAQYGGRLSSVIDVATRNGNKQRVSAAASLAPFLGSVRLEVPFVPEHVSILASVRESVIERVAPDVLGERLPYRFGDRFVKVHAFLNRTSSLSLTGLNTFDRGDVADTDGRTSTIRWNNQAYGGHYIYLPESQPVLARVSFFITRMDNRYQPFGGRQRHAEAQSFGGEIGFTYYLGPTVIRFGLFGQSHRFSFALAPSPDLHAFSNEEFLTEGGIYLGTSIDASRTLQVEPGVRLHTFPSRAAVKLEPRLRARWQPDGATGRHTFSAAWGLFHQEVVGLYNTRDVTDAFVIWTPSSPNTDVPRAMHLVGGWQGQVWPRLTLGAEAYYKDLAHLSFAEFNDDTDAGLRIDEVTGAAYGLDLKAETNQSWFYGAINYGLAWVAYERTMVRMIQELQNGMVVSREDIRTQRFTPPHDRRHQVNVLLQFSRGPYALNLRWLLGSGLPFTSTQGFYDALHVPHDADDQLHTQPGKPVLVQSEDIYGVRLPAYHRLDMSLERRFQTRWLTATVQASLINVYDRANLFSYDLFAGQRVNQLPLIPSLGLLVQAN